MQIVAMLTMLIDHVGLAFFPDQIEWRVIGRISFPIYAYCIIMGYRHTSNLKIYMLRLLIIALISQYPYMLVIEANGLNVVGTLLIALMVLYGLDKYKGLLPLLVIIAVASVMLEVFNFSYGMYGLLLVLIYRYGKLRSLVPLHLILNVIFVYLKGWYMGIFNIIPTILIVHLPLFFAYIEKLRFPRWLWRSFYPAHLAILALLLQFQMII